VREIIFVFQLELVAVISTLIVYMKLNMVVLQGLRIQLLDPSTIVLGWEETGLVVREDGIVVMDSIAGTTVIKILYILINF
jgi:hypothetical protein